MHHIGILPPSYFSMRGIPHDLVEHEAIILRRWTVIISFTIICLLRVKISVNLRRMFSWLSRRLAFLRTCSCNDKANDDTAIDDSVSCSPSHDDKSSLIVSQPSGQVLSNSTLFVWALFWFVAMALRRLYGDDNLLIGDIASITIFYVYPILIVFTHTNIKRFVKRRIVLIYNRSVQDMLRCMYVVCKWCRNGCLKEPQKDDKCPCIKDNDENPDQWAIRIREVDVESIQINDVCYIDNESISNVQTISNDSCTVESVE